MNVKAVRRVPSREVNGAEKQVKCSPPHHPPPAGKSLMQVMCQNIKPNLKHTNFSRSCCQSSNYSLAYLCISEKGVIGSKSFSHNFSQPFLVERVSFVYE